MTNAAPPPPGQYSTPQPMSPADEKLWATLVHIGGIFFGFIPALVGYLVLKDRGPFVRDHTRVALNFQISYTIYAVAATVLLLIIAIPLAFVTFGLSFGLVYLVFLLPIVATIFMIIAAVKANQGVYYTYPLTIDFIKR
ncbi:DUF4870 domain-containing protein [Salinibacterium sp. SYSU T00001]|uniref:DUF4870 domain-containing protein n=1 Tax=Homoserinimonas sedimenticola TaxID=2986805 RepID=UPI0022369DD3|nr:DUF4870 domain-containing protein [Salinibacterium sedimenticola]MCW4384598.1 DUF4870 domain-containing protein [Salinibacterium sedimenticola]